MASRLALATVVISSLYILAHADVFEVEGNVFCDPCGVQFETPLSTKLGYAVVRLYCVDPKTRKVTYTVEGQSDARGQYRLRVEGDHEDEVCRVRAVHSSQAHCAVALGDMYESRVVCTNNSGMHTDVRYANPVGFMTKVTDPRCASVLQDVLADIGSD